MGLFRKEKEIKIFKLSEDAILFLKKYIIPEMNISAKIDEGTMDKIIELSSQWELDMIDTKTKNFMDKNYDYSERERNEMADAFVGEITGQWIDGICEPDFADINKKLELR